MISIQIKLLFLSLTGKKLFQQTSQKKIQMNYRKKILTDFSKIKIFWSNSEKKQIIKTFTKCFIFNKKSTSWICFNDNTNIAIQCLKKWKNHDFTFCKFKNCRNKHYNNSKTLSAQKYDYHTLFMKLQFLISLFRKKACQDMLFDQQKNLIS